VGLVFQQQWARQSHAAVGINWANPLTRGLKFLAVPVDGGWIDLYTRIPAINTNSQTFDRIVQAPGFAGSQVGRATKGSTSGHFKWPAQLPVDLITGPMTAFIEGSMTADALSENQGAAFNTGDVVVGSGWTVGFDDASTYNNSWYLFTNTGGSGTQHRGGQDVLGASAEKRAHRLCASFDGTNVRLFNNGTFNSSSAGTAPITHSTRRARIIAAHTIGVRVCRDDPRGIHGRR